MKVKVSKVKLSDAAIKVGSVTSYLRKLYTVVNISHGALALVERVSDEQKIDSLAAPVHLDFVVIPMNRVAISVQTAEVTE